MRASNQGWISGNGGYKFSMAIGYCHNGDRDNAMLWLDKLYAIRGADILSLKADPDFDPLRSDPRFQDLLRRIGFP